MNKKLLVVSGFVLVVIASVVYGVAMKDDAPTPSSASSSSTAPRTAEKPAQQSSESMASGSYVDYSPETLANASGERVLFFHAPWCGQCKQIDSDIKKQGVPAGITIIKVDYDDNQDLREKYGITFRTSFIKLDASGNKVGDEYIAYNEPTFEAVKREFL